MTDMEARSKVGGRGAALANAKQCSEGADLCLLLKGEIAAIAKSRKLSAADVANTCGGTEKEMLGLLQRDYDPAELWRLMEVLRSIGGLMVLGVERLPNHQKGAVLWIPLSEGLVAPAEESGTPEPSHP